MGTSPGRRLRRKQEREHGLPKSGGPRSTYTEMTAILAREFDRDDEDDDNFVLLQIDNEERIKAKVYNLREDHNPSIEFWPEGSSSRLVGALHYEVNSRIYYGGMSPYVSFYRYGTTRDRVPFVAYTLAGKRLFSGEAKEKICIGSIL